MALSKKPVNGMKDILPEEMQIRDYVQQVIKETYRSFGFTPIETPCMENIANLSNKQGGENEKLIFKVMKRGEKLKVAEAKEEATISSIVGPRELYRLTDTLYQDNPQMEGRQSTGHKYSLGANIFDIFPELFSDTCTVNESEMAEIYGRADNRRCFKWIKRRYITQPDNFEKYKVIIPEANGTGAIGEVLSTPLVGVPVVGYTDTFIGIGAFDTEIEANACLKYIKTKFARTMLGTLKATQHNPRETWANVPMQDFTSESDINWDAPISEIDKQLYSKYRLSDEEIQFIEQNVKSMA